MRRVIAALAATAAGLAALLSFKSHGTAAALPFSQAGAANGGTVAGASPTPSADGGSTDGPSGSGGSASVGPSASPSATGSTATGSTVSHSYTGAEEETPFGPVEVSISVRGGKLTGVTVLEVPDRGGYEQGIVQEVVPELTSEAISSQGKSVDAVSGATYTSNAYIQSLQSALDAAGI